LGYLGQISPEELTDPRFSGYRAGDRLGRGGVERHYEEALRGVDGWEKLLVNSQGKILNELGSQAPVPGSNLVLSIDRGIQQLAERALVEGVENARRIYDRESAKYLLARAGAVVVLDPNTGKLLALASYPNYDPRIFLGGLSEQEWRRLNDPVVNYPLNNRAIQGLYPPGSVFKPFVAAAAMKAGYATPFDYYDCPAQYTAPGDTSGTVFHNWKPTDSGQISIQSALIESCDTVFYEFGWRFNRDRITRNELFQRLMRKWGFGRPTGVDLPSESEGRVPDIEWKEDVHERAPLLFPEGLWLPGDNINMSIGQGDLLVTPLQVASAYAALANGGTLYRPQVGLRVEQPDGEVIDEVEPHVAGRVPFTAQQLQVIRDALRQVPVSGTARTSFSEFPLSRIPIAGKTGTSEVFGKQPTSWFAAYGPADDAQYVVVAVVEEGGHGSQVAAPIVRRIFEGLFGLTPSEFHVGEEAD
ncbi:MAG: penicillin-binding transpeptidase domain-containing protein, partial [Actinomycetota bacterium]